MSFEHLTNFSIPQSLIDETGVFLRAVGRTGNEAIALWVGSVEGSSACVSDVVIPRQTPIRSSDGLAIYIDATTLHELNVWLHTSRLRLLGQVHSHGEDAYHSDTDDHHSVVTTFGALSIVVPFFAQEPMILSGCAVHRLTKSGWVELPADQAAQLITVEG